MTIRALSGTTSPHQEMTVIEDSATHVVEIVEPVAVNLRTLGIGFDSSTDGWGVLSAPKLVGGIWAVTVESPWGVTADGQAYYDAEGAVSSDAAVASLDSSGALVLTRPGG